MSFFLSWQGCEGSYKRSIHAADARQTHFARNSIYFPLSVAIFLSRAASATDENGWCRRSCRLFFTDSVDGKWGKCIKGDGMGVHLTICWLQ